MIAAAEPTGDPVLVWSAADRLGIPRNTADELESTGLLGMGVRIVFRHPLVRSAMYRHAQPEARRRVHQALAEVIDGAADPDRRAWHRALAAPGPDEEVAAELERSAGRAARRGGLGVAAAFLERAVMLSQELESRGRRVLAAAEAKLDAGQPQRAEELLSMAKLGAQSGLEVAQREVLEARVAYMRGRGRDVPGLLLSAAMRLDAVGGSSSRDIYDRAMTAALYAGRLSAGADVADVAAAARASPTHRPRSIRDLRSRTIAAFLIDGHANATPLALELIEALRSREISSPDDVELLAGSANLAALVWDDEAWAELTTRALRLARNLGCLAALPVALNGRTGTLVMQGDFAAAASLVHESKELSEATGMPEMAYPRLTSRSVWTTPGGPRSHPRGPSNRCGTRTGAGGHFQ